MLPPAGGLLMLGDGQASALFGGKCGPGKPSCGPGCQCAGPAAGRPLLAKCIARLALCIVCSTLLSAPSTREGACDSLMVSIVLAIALEVPRSRSCHRQVSKCALFGFNGGLMCINGALTGPMESQVMGNPLDTSKFKACSIALTL